MGDKIIPKEKKKENSMLIKEKKMFQRKNI